MSNVNELWWVFTRAGDGGECGGVLSLDRPTPRGELPACPPGRHPADRPAATRYFHFGEMLISVSFTCVWLCDVVLAHCFDVGVRSSGWLRFEGYQLHGLACQSQSGATSDWVMLYAVTPSFLSRRFSEVLIGLWCKQLRKCITLPQRCITLPSKMYGP